MDDNRTSLATDAGWPGAVGAMGGCLAVVSTILFVLCLGAYAASTLFTMEQGQPRPLVPGAALAFWVLALLTLVVAVLAGVSLGIRAFGDRTVSTGGALRITFVSALLPLRYVVGAIQSLLAVAICPLLFIAPSYVLWDIGALVVMSIFQGGLLLTIRLLGGPGAASAITESEG